MSERIARIKADRLQRWSLYAGAPFLWLAVAFMNPFLLLVVPFATLALWKAMQYGIVDRHDPPDDPDFF